MKIIVNSYKLFIYLFHFFMLPIMKLLNKHKYFPIISTNFYPPKKTVIRQEASQAKE